ncbi:hypothetical protein V6Z12_D10G143600 [Gossypium hirsutum]
MPIQFVGSSILPGMKLMKGTIPFFTRISLLGFNSRYNFNKVARYKQLTLEEAKEKMKNKRKTADDCERWMMKAANNSAAAFGEVEKIDEK